MNPLVRIFSAVILTFAFLGCSKNINNTSNSLTSSVNVINAAVNVAGIKVNTNGVPIIYASATQVGYGASAIYYVPRITTPVTVVASADTTTYLLNKSFDFHSGIYSLYIAGQAGAIDTILKEETSYPFIRTDVVMPDSSIYLRFVNLSPNSSPININIKSSTATEATSLSYKSITDFKKYPALAANANYIFEIRDASSNTLLISYTFNVTATNRFKNVAIILKGLAGTTTGTNTLSAFASNYF